MPADLMIDLSSNNPIPDLKKYWDAGYRKLALKATESTTYTWTKGQALGDEWHKFGAQAEVWWYHFGRPGNAVAQAKYFLAAVSKHRKPQDRVVLDAEIQGVDGKFSNDFFNVVHAAVGNREEIYGSPYFIRSEGIKPNHEQGLWLAEYGPKADIPPGWKAYDAWQYTDRAKGVPGESGAVDESRLSNAVVHDNDPKPAAKPAAKPAPKPAPKAVVHNPFRPPAANELPIKRGSVDTGTKQGVRFCKWALGRSTTGKSAGKFGVFAVQSLKRFQRKHGLKPSGVVDSATLSVLKSVIR